MPNALERLERLESERDALRERLASFESGTENLHYRAELERLQTQAAELSAANEQLRRRISASKKRSDSRPLTGLIDLLKRIVDRA